MHKVAKFICKYSKVILVIALLLLIPSLIGMKATRVNYDILVYLPDDIETIQGENVLTEDFNMGGFSIIIIEIFISLLLLTTVILYEYEVVLLLDSVL